MSAYKPNSTTTITEHEAGQIGGGRDTVDSPGRGRDGATPSSRNAAMSLRTKNGDPPVASQHAVAKPGSGSAPNPPRPAWLPRRS
jgi:hypothetical protein